MRVRPPGLQLRRAGVGRQRQELMAFRPNGELLCRLPTLSSSDRYRAEAPTSPDIVLVPCPACVNDSGESTGQSLVLLPSVTWIRKRCGSCLGLRKLDREGIARH